MRKIAVFIGVTLIAAAFFAGRASGAAGPLTLIVEHTEHVPSDPTGVSYVSAQCPHRRQATGAGSDLPEANTGVRVVSSSPIGEDDLSRPNVNWAIGWSLAVRNNSGSDADVRLWVICLRKPSS